MAVLGESTRSFAVQVFAVDSSPAALAWAQLNVERLNLASRVLVSKMISCHIHVPCIVTTSCSGNHVLESFPLEYV